MEVDNEDLMGQVNEIVPFHMKHNAEPEAVDLLIEVERLEILSDHVTEANYARTCLYLFSCSSYLPEPEDSEVLKVAHAIFMKVGKYTDAMRGGMPTWRAGDHGRDLRRHHGQARKTPAVLHACEARTPAQA